MKKENKIISKLAGLIIPDSSDIRVCAFNILAVCGIIVSAVTAFYNLAQGFGIVSFLECFCGVIISMALMFYTRKTGNYRLAMVLTVLAVFLGLFTFLFLSNGGIYSGIPYFFVFAVVFTAFLLDGILMPVLVAIELVWYAFLCIYTYYNPLPQNIANEGLMYVLDVVVCETLVAVIIACAMYFQMRLYRKKQLELSTAMHIAEEANKAKSDFLAKMSHDIRTPLNMIMGMNELIVANTSSTQIREWVNDSNISGKILLSLIDDMLDLTRIEAGRLEIFNQPWSTKRLFDETTKVWKLQTDKAGLDFVYEMEEKVPEYLMGDEGVIRKIANNLLSNSVKYTKSGSICFNVRSVETSENDISSEWLVIEVADTGVGIAPDYLDKIFKPFERGIQDIYRETNGSGLGLAIVKELVDGMGGTIECESTPGEGSVFTVKLPQKVCADNNEDKITSLKNTILDKAVSHRFIAPSARILVVDDNVYNRKVIEGFLSPTLIQIDDVESGYEALEMIDIKEYDLVLMDLRMPKMDGVETLERIREEYPEFDTPVVVLTADIMNNVEEKLLKRGFAGFLAKPVSSSQLIEMMSHYIGDKMVLLETEDDKSISLSDVDVYRNLLMPYGINLSLALEFNAGNTEEFLNRAYLFDEYAPTGIDRLLNPENTEYYYIQIHSLKSGAKGVGAYLLAELAETIEYRKDEDYREVAAPVLIEEYKRVCDGLKVLFKEVKYKDEP